LRGVVPAPRGRSRTRPKSDAQTNGLGRSRYSAETRDARCPLSSEAISILTTLLPRMTLCGVPLKSKDEAPQSLRLHRQSLLRSIALESAKLAKLHIAAGRHRSSVARVGGRRGALASTDARAIMSIVIEGGVPNGEGIGMGIARKQVSTRGDLILWWEARRYHFNGFVLVSVSHLGFLS
jgi:hypothetical protein